MRRLLALILALVVVLSMTACGAGNNSAPAAQNSSDSSNASTNGSSGADASKFASYNAIELKQEWIDDPSIGDVTGGPDGRKTKITTAALANPKSVAPWITFASQTDFLYAMYQTMWGTEPGGTEEIGIIFKDWEWTDDYTLVANLYDYITDAKGYPLKASDVVFSIGKWQESHVTSTSSQIESVEATGEYQVTFHFNVKYYFGLLTSLTCFVVTERAFNESPDGMVTTPCGTGPYKLREFVAGSHIIMERNYDFWQKDQSLLPTCMRAHVDVVELDVITENGQKQTAAETGAVQATVVTSKSAEALSNKQGVNIFMTDNQATMGIEFNLYNGVLKDLPLVRKAICYALNNEAIAAVCTDGSGYAAKGLGYSGLPGYLDKWNDEDYYDYNVEKAKELMAEAGYPDGGIEIRLMGQGPDERHQKMAQLVEAQLAAIGITVIKDLPDGAVYGTNRINVPTGGWDICLTYNKCCNYIPAGYKMFLGNAYEWGNQLGQNDPELQEKLMTALYSGKEEDIDALHQFAKEQAGLYIIFIERIFSCVDDSIVSPVLNHENAASPAAAIFSEDYAVYDE